MKVWQLSVLKAIHRFHRLSWARKHLLIGTLFLMALVRCSLWLWPFSRSHRLWTIDALSLVPIPRLKNVNPSQQFVRPLEQQQQAIWAIEHAARLIPDATCLVQAYALHVLLAKNGIDSTLKIGVRHTASKQIEAHAWLEKDGELLIGDLPDLAAYSTLPPL